MMVGASHRLRALQRGVGPLSGKVATAYAKVIQAGIVQRCRTKRFEYRRFQTLFK